jgi:hypothetical protein
MYALIKKSRSLSFQALVVISLLFLIFSFLFFSKAKTPDWIYVGDTLNTLVQYSFHYSGIARGEYAIWNPLLRAGESEVIFQMFDLAKPISNLVIVTSLLLNIKDIVFSYAVFIYTMITIYASGLFLLVRCWTNNRYAGIFASILAISSSSVLFYAYHLSFVHILHTLPWMLYSLTMYSRNFRFRYLVIFALSYCIFLYSYEFIMGLLYLIVLSISCIVFYYKELPNFLRKLKKIPVRHLLAAGFILFIISLPIVFIFFEYKSNLLAISRASNIQVSDKYTLSHEVGFSKIIWFPLLPMNFFITLFTGFIFRGFNELRHYIGPVSMPFLAVALFSFHKRAKCLALSALLICAIAANLFPLNLVLKLPLYSSIRNLHFFPQFFLMAAIILAGFGFDFLMKSRSLFLKKVFNAAAVSLFLISLLLLVTGKSVYHGHNNAILLLSVFAMPALLYLVNFQALNRQAASILAVSAVVSICAYFLIGQMPGLSGGLNNSRELLALRERADHSLKFRFERPDDIQKVHLYDFWKKRYTDFGRDEYSSMLTLTDNSYKSLGRKFGLSSFPFLKNYYLFLSLPGHELMMKKKFFFFKNFFISNKPEDMLAFKRDPDLFRLMLEKNIGIMDEIKGDDAGASLGLFNPLLVEKLPLDAGKDNFDVSVKEYKANSICLNVSTDEPGLFAYTDLWDKDWQVNIDGEPASLKKVFHTFKGVIVPGGTHEIKFIYRSNAYLPILGMNIMFVLCLGALLIYPVLSLITKK